MNTVTSKDGTTIAFDKTGQGPAIILVAGAFSYRAFPMLEKIAAELSQHFTVINYDRRGRGDSGDSASWTIEREIEDIEALIDEAGGSAYVWGLSSGAVLSLRAAASGLNITKLALYQPPFMIDDSGPLPPSDFAERLGEMVAADRRGDAVKLMMTKGMGAPAFAITMMSLFPVWKRLKALAHTLPYDFAIMGDTVTGKPLPADPWASITTPTLVLDGEKSPARAHQGARAAADILPNARYQTLKGQGHTISPDSLVPVLKDFFGN